MMVKIGVMDSGVGGLTILEALQMALPNAEFVYFADQAYAPYGALSNDFIASRLISIAHFFQELKCCLMVVACNTATVAGIQELREQASLPIVGVEPAVKPACLRSRMKRVSVLATESTSKSVRLNDLIQTWRFDTEVQVLSSRHLATYIDRMPDSFLLTQQEVDKLARLVNTHQSDSLVLACTHYPLIKSMFCHALPGVEIVEPSAGVTAQVQRVLNNIHPEWQKDLAARSIGRALLLSNGGHDYLNCLRYWSKNISSATFECSVI